MCLLHNLLLALLLVQLTLSCAPLIPGIDGNGTVDGSKLGKEARISLLISPPTPWSYNKEGMFTTAQAPTAMKAQDNMLRDLNKAIKIILIESNYATNWVSQVSLDPSFTPIEGWVGNSCAEGDDHSATVTPGVTPGTEDPTTDNPNQATKDTTDIQGQTTEAITDIQGQTTEAITDNVEATTDAPAGDDAPAGMLQMKPRRGRRAADHGHDHPMYQDYEGMISKICGADLKVSGDFEYAVALRVTTKMPITERSWNEMALKLQDKLTTKGINFYQDIRVDVTYI